MPVIKAVSDIDAQLAKAKQKLVLSGLDFLMFMSDVLYDDENHVQDVPIEERTQIARAIDAYIQNLKRLNAEGYEFTLLLPMVQNIEGPLCTRQQLETSLPSLKDKHYHAFNEKKALVESAQATLVEWHERDHQDRVFKKNIVSWVAAGAFLTGLYFLTLGVTIATASACMLLLAVATMSFSWHSLSAKSQYEWLNPAFEVTMPERELQGECERYRFFTEETPENQSKQAGVSAALTPAS